MTEPPGHRKHKHSHKLFHLNPLARAVQNKRNVVWLCGAVRVANAKLSLGVCSESRRVYYLALDSGQSAMIPLVVQDLYLHNPNGCEEERRCLYLECPRNKTWWHSYRQSASWTSQAIPNDKAFQNLVWHIRKIEQHLQPEIAQIDWAKKHAIRVFDEPVLEIRIGGHDCCCTFWAGCHPFTGEEGNCDCGDDPDE